ncbi:Fc receptor-like protein 2 [Gracilinanus agilis]|uniref:Fc receptor-like protein 2 n=1 Tax=Gracilinanus agilis TaxID=191870 RepID=UPI001CFE953E|nr:Fc receptor-like protein 2 [Gracilinanus agilis]
MDVLTLNDPHEGIAVAQKAVVIPSPPWTPVFKEEKVTLTCKGFNLLIPEKSWWYYERRWQEKSNPIEVTKNGEYRCHFQNLSSSDPVDPVFSNDWLILQTPYLVFEGDTLNLQCRAWKNYSLKEISYYKNKKPISVVSESSTFSIPHVNPQHNGRYNCKAKFKKWNSVETSKEVKLQVQELFPPPELKATTSQPTEGTSVTLSCETQLPSQRSDTKLHFSFFRDGRVITSSWKNSQVLQIPVIWREDSGSYWCEAKAVTQDVYRQSKHLKIQVKRIPLAGILLETQPSETQVIEGEKLILICSVAEGTGNITFCWLKDDTKECIKRRTQHSLKDELVLSMMTKSDEGEYHCIANNNISTIASNSVAITVIIPVAQPLLTLSAIGMQAIAGDVVEFRCEALRGSAPIFYQFYHKDLILKKILAPFGGAASFNLSVTPEHSGNYFCKANNSFNSQRSEMLSLSISDPKKRNLLIMGITVSLLGIMVIAAIALLVYFKFQRKSGGSSAPEPSRDPPVTHLQESGHLKSTTPMELQPVYTNVTPFIEDVIYSEVWSINQGRLDTANNSESPPEKMDFSVLYSDVKTYSPSNSTRNNKNMDRNHEDDTENYENILFS